MTLIRIAAVIWVGIAFGISYSSASDEYGELVTPMFSNKPRVGSKSLNFNALQELIKKNDVKTIEQLIPLLPEDYRRYYTLMYKSDSMQEATAKQPRVIMYGPDSRFIIAFTGSDKLKGGAIIETIEWQEDGANFKFREISFDQKNRTESPHFEQNPDSCIACHRSDSRPNWEAYPLWPGAYGSHEATLPGSKEDEWYKSFQNEKASNPRYASLLNYKVNSSYGHYTFQNDASKLPPNGMLGNYLGVLNLKRVLKRTVDADSGRPYSKFKYALAATALQCTKNFDFQNTEKDNLTTYPVEELVSPNLKFPKAITNAPATFQDALSEVWNAQNANFDRIESDVAKVNYAYPKEPGERVGPNDNHGVDQHHLIASYHYILSRMGMNIDDYAMTLAHNTFAFGTFGSGMSTLSTSILDHIRRGKDPDLKFLFNFLSDIEGPDGFDRYKIKGSPKHRAICDQLKKLSQNALKAYTINLKQKANMVGSATTISDLVGSKSVTGGSSPSSAKDRSIARPVH